MRLPPAKSAQLGVIHPTAGQCTNEAVGDYGIPSPDPAIGTSPSGIVAGNYENIDGECVAEHVHGPPIGHRRLEDLTNHLLRFLATDEGASKDCAAVRSKGIDCLVIGVERQITSNASVGIWLKNALCRNEMSEVLIRASKHEVVCA